MPGPWRDRLLTALGHVLHVRRSELDRTLRMTGLAIVLGCSMYTAFNATQAIFLVRTGPRAYPLFFVILALSVWPAIAFQAYSNRRLGLGHSFRYTLLLNSAIPIPIFVAYRFAETGPVAFVAYVVYSVAFEIVMLQFWSFVSQYFNILEAKRIFPVIAAGSGLGYIFAGAITTFVASHNGPEPLMFVWAAGAALSGLFAYRSERRLFRPPVDDDADEFAAEAQRLRGKGVIKSIAGAIAYLRVSRLVVALVLLGTVLLVTMRISDYFVALFFVRATTNVNDLTVLIGNAWMLSYVVQLALGLWITPWLLAKAGVKNAILALPAATLLGFVAVTVAPGLAASLFLFVVRNGLQTGVDDPAQNVLAGALPEQVTPHLKVLQDNLVLPGSAVLTGLGLLITSYFIGTTSVALLALLGLLACLLFLTAALTVRGLYVSAIYQRLHAHTLSLSDLELALGRPSAGELEELKSFVRGGSPEVRQFAAAALGRLAPDTFQQLIPELAIDPDGRLRQLAFQMCPPGSLPEALLEQGAADIDPWVVAAAAVQGGQARPPWPRAEELLSELYAHSDAESKAASVWAAAFLGDHHQVAESLSDERPRVRLEAIKSFAKLKANVAGAADPLMACLQDENVDVRREALRQALRWAPPAGSLDDFSHVLVANLASADPVSRKLAGEAIAIQCPAALEQSLRLLEGETPVAVATIEAIFRSNRRDLILRVESHLEDVLDLGIESAQAAGRLAGLRRLAGGDESEDFRFAVLRVALEDYVRHVIQLTLAGLRALHEKRGFARVERGLQSKEVSGRAEAVETLLNFGPARLADPLVRLLDPENFESFPSRPLSEPELALLERHPDAWVKRAAEAVRLGAGDSMKDLIALKKVPLFANLTLEQLASIDRLMITRRYLPGETIFKLGDHSDELYVILEGEVRIHRDHGPRRPVTLARLGPSSVMGEMAPFTEQPRSAGAQATTSTIVRVLRKDRLTSILHEHPEVLLEVIKNLSSRLVVANEQLEQAARPVPESEPPAVVPPTKGSPRKAPEAAGRA
ncbi:MAG: hypothetical protein NVS9B1_07150 [Candidatus Dormibacteraceae bacterium]